MGYVTMYGYCYGCKRPFTYNPYKVPSLTINGVREPFCRNCIDAANPERIKRGLPPIEPLPGAYEPAPEYDDLP